MDLKLAPYTQVARSEEELVRRLIDRKTEPLVGPSSEVIMWLGLHCFNCLCNRQLKRLGLQFVCPYV